MMDTLLHPPTSVELDFTPFNKVSHSKNLCMQHD